MFGLCVYFEVFHGAGDEDSDAQHSCSDAEEDAPPRKRLRAYRSYSDYVVVLYFVLLGTTTMERWTSKSTTLITGIHIQVTNSETPPQTATQSPPLYSGRLKITVLKFKT